MIPAPSESTVLRLATIARRVEELLALDRKSDRAPVGLKNLRNERRRTVEAVMILLADPEMRAYLAELDRLGALS